MIRAEYIKIAPEVQDALREDRPVVALESTIIAHGMPQPANVETALEVERIVRANGAVPATIGILAGEIKLGLSAEEIAFFGSGQEILKAGERDIPLAVARRLHAATTAGASLSIAAAAGVRVFVTGGIGGVAPQAGATFDISADLLAIAEYPCLTVCAGTKAFMDVPATLEYLETQRVPVVGYRESFFPFFFSRDSGCELDWVAQDAAEVADFFAARLAMGLAGGMLVGVALPAAEALPEETTQAAIRAALDSLQGQDIHGKEVTPYLLRVIAQETGGKSLAANVALIKNNARVGAEIALALTLACHRRLDGV
jgi:pseudouridine-5'-phosphate glycosidase